MHVDGAAHPDALASLPAPSALAPESIAVPLVLPPLLRPSVSTTSEQATSTIIAADATSTRAQRTPQRIEPS